MFFSKLHKKNYHGVDYFKFLLEDNFVSLKDFFIESSGTVKSLKKGWAQIHRLCILQVKKTFFSQECDFLKTDDWVGFKEEFMTFFQTFISCSEVL